MTEGVRVDIIMMKERRVSMTHYRQIIVNLAVEDDTEECVLEEIKEQIEQQQDADEHERDEADG